MYLCVFCCLASCTISHQPWIYEHFWPACPGESIQFWPSFYNTALSSQTHTLSLSSHIDKKKEGLNGNILFLIIERCFADADSMLAWKVFSTMHRYYRTIRQLAQEIFLYCFRLNVEGMYLLIPFLPQWRIGQKKCLLIINNKVRLYISFTYFFRGTVLTGLNWIRFCLKDISTEEVFPQARAEIS